MCRLHRALSHRPGRSGLTLVELTTAIAIVAIMTTALGALVHAVKVASEYTEGTSNAVQHGRVALGRIATAVSQGFANENFPGAAVFGDTIGMYSYPDTLVVWHPNGRPADPTGLPLFSEIVVYCPDPSVPTRLLEITSSSDLRTVPQLNAPAAWAIELNSLKTGPTSQKILITDLLRTARPTSGSTLRGAVRFMVDLQPSASTWANFRAGTVTFDKVPWVQTVYGSQTGLRQTWVRTELQLMPGDNLMPDTMGTVAIAFPGSTALYWTQNR